jgi:hypothetical protein
MSYKFMGWRISSIEDAQQEALEFLKTGRSYVPAIYRELLTEDQQAALDAQEGRCP